MAGRVVVCADDYAISEGTSAVILELLKAGAINATTCLVETDAWPRTAGALRALAAEKPGIGVGLHLNLTEHFGHEADAASIRPLHHWLLDALKPPSRAAVETALHAFRGQWGLFLRQFGRAPDFLDGHQHVQLYGAAREAVLRLAMETDFKGWLRQSGTSGTRLTAQRILMDPLSARLTSRARAIGLAVNPGFGGLRGFQRAEDLEKLWEADLAGFKDGGLLIVHPGAAGSPAGTDGIDGCRIDEAALLRTGRLAGILARHGLSLAADARRPGWPPAAPASPGPGTGSA